MRIRHLPDYLVNQIAAGEVIERPAAAIKELVENALDASSTSINIDCRDGGKSFMSVRDNGIGIDKDDLVKAICRHATSKLPDDDLVFIKHLGFRGEALPSIGSVSRLSIKSKTSDNPSAWEIKVEGGVSQNIMPSALQSGTVVDVRDLFYATPARLKFLKSDRSEFSAIKDTITQIAMAFPNVGFALTHNEKLSFQVMAETGTPEEQRKNRLSAILGKEFSNNSIQVFAERDGIRISGYAGLPTLSRATSQMQFLFVNGRPIKDRLLLGCVRAAYMDVLHHGRHPIVALYIDIPADLVDVNVHPAKSEVRFQDSAHIRGLIITALKNALHQAGMMTSSTLSVAALSKMHTNQNYLPSYTGRPFSKPSSYPIHSNYNLAEHQQNSYNHNDEIFLNPAFLPYAAIEDSDNESKDIEYPLGAARTQIHENYIIAQTSAGIVIVDQHAAHERLVYERFKQQLRHDHIPSQGLLIPEIIDLTDTQISCLIGHQEYLKKLGLEIDCFGIGSIAVSAIPAIFNGKIDLKKLINDILDELSEDDTSNVLEKKINEILSLMACHGSVRSGRKLNVSEMNSLLREMEETANSGHCNHGRPTYIQLDLKDIEKLFGRR